MEKNNIQSKKPGKSQKFMEWIWLFFAILSLVTWIYSFLKEETNVNNMLLVISGVSFLMYFLRRHLGKKKES